MASKSREKQVARCLNELESMNMRHIAGDRDIQSVINDYFLDDNGENSSMTDEGK